MDLLDRIKTGIEKAEDVESLDIIELDERLDMAVDLWSYNPAICGFGCGKNCCGKTG